MRPNVSALCGLLLVAAFGAAMAQDLPPLPPAIAKVGALHVGVRCDQPPYGFQDKEGHFAGVEVEIAKQIAAYGFGSPDKAEMICVTAENRIPQLISGKVDMLVATLGKTPERARVIDYSIPYNWGGSDILVPKDSSLKKLADIGSATPVAMLKGTTQAAWFDANMPNLETLRLNSVSDALQALKQGRAKSMAADLATLVVIVEKDPTLRRLDEPFAVTTAGVGVRKNEPEWLAYVNASLEKMAKGGLYTKWIEKWVPEDKWALYKTQFPPAKPPAM
ncbi:MAG: transporter substrate-binding domain-containing protein [Acetobacteraceae bacterium]|nr:transporter substrate-binding domain-containing protein [Acetobacteraceae bacterium]